MNIYPAIDIRGGRCVRLLQGRKDQETVYGDDPAAVAQRWQQAGATYIHVVDLDGAFSGNTQNEESITRILDQVSIPIQLGGGIRSMDDIQRWLSLGISLVIIGTAAVKDPGLVISAIERWGPDHVIVGIDAKEGEVAISGWEAGSTLTARHLAQQVRDAGVQRIVYTDIARDGMMTGPNIEATKHLARESGLQVIASGGVSAMEDLVAVSATHKDGVEGVIVGKALYEGTVDLAQAVQMFQAT